MTGVFSEDVVVEQVADGRYQAVLDHSWDLKPLPQGGIVASFGLRAATAAVADSSQRLRTCTAVFAGQVAAGHLEIEAVVLRRGRSATQVMATVRNPESASGTTLLAVFGSDRRGPSFGDVAPPSVPTVPRGRGQHRHSPASVRMPVRAFITVEKSVSGCFGGL